MIHLDLFSGIGGFSKGLQEAGLPITKTIFSEKDKTAISVYQRNLPDAEYAGTVEHVSRRGLPGGEYIVTFGFPCQDLSVAGKRKGFDGSRSSLFFEAMRIIDEIRPSVFIFENVKGFFSSNDGKDFTIALQTIADIGVYECQWQLLNTRWFLPQNRERVYFVGCLGEGCGREIFPVVESYPKDKEIFRGSRHGIIDPNYVERDCRYYSEYSPTLKARNYKEPPVVCGQLRTQSDGGFREMKSNISPSLTARARQDGSGQPIIYRPADLRINGKQNGLDVVPSITATNCSKRSDQAPVVDGLRRLTPVECERLQGFPDNWTKYGHEGQLISDTQRYKMCGNAVSVPVVKAIGERLI